MDANDGSTTPRVQQALSLATWGAFVAGACAFAWLLWTWGPPAAVLQAEGVELPVASGWMITLAGLLRSGPGLAALAAAVAVLSVPVFRGARGSGAVKAYGGLASVMVLGAAASWWFLARPVEQVAQHLLAMPG